MICAPGCGTNSVQPVIGSGATEPPVPPLPALPAAPPVPPPPALPPVPAPPLPAPALPPLPALPPVPPLPAPPLPALPPVPPLPADPPIPATPPPTVMSGPTPSGMYCASCVSTILSTATPSSRIHRFNLCAPDAGRVNAMRPPGEDPCQRQLRCLPVTSSAIAAPS